MSKGEVLVRSALPVLFPFLNRERGDSGAGDRWSGLKNTVVVLGRAMKAQGELPARHTCVHVGNFYSSRASPQHTTVLKPCAESLQCVGHGVRVETMAPSRGGVQERSQILMLWTQAR